MERHGNKRNSGFQQPNQRHHSNRSGNSGASNGQHRPKGNSHKLDGNGQSNFHRKPSRLPIDAGQEETGGAAMRPPLRPKDPATSGRLIELAANHFKCAIKATAVYHYDVAIYPHPKKSIAKKIFDQFVEQEPRMNELHPVFDGQKSIYTAKRIAGLDSRVDIKFQFVNDERQNPTPEEYVVSIQPTGNLEIDLSVLDTYSKAGSSIDVPLRAIQALDIVLKYSASKRKIPIGNCLFSQNEGRTVDLGHGVESWCGHFQSLRVGWKPWFNIDSTQKAFIRPGPVVDWLAEVTRTRPGDGATVSQYEDFSRKLKTVKVEYKRKNYKVKVTCHGLGRKSARDEKFEIDGQLISVQTYFERMLDITLQHPHLPCLWVGSVKRKNYVPMEICSVVAGQEYKRKLSDIQTTRMIRAAAAKPDERRRKIECSVADLNLPNDPVARSFGISFDQRMTTVTGRVLPAPKLVYRQDESDTIEPIDGVWNMKGKQFVDPRSLHCWGILNISMKVGDERIKRFVIKLIDVAQAMGMTIGACQFLDHCDRRELETRMRQWLRDLPDLQLLFVIIDRKGDPAYEIVKKFGDLDLNLLTQCIQAGNIIGKNGSPDPTTLANICLKLNCKLGGVNSLIQRDVRPRILRQEQVIIMGADVTHPGADHSENGKPSIAAVVGSIDPTAFRYCAEIRVQKPRQEHIEDMEEMVYNILLKFNQINGRSSSGKPQRIIFFRDGVSEGQFAMVIGAELTAIRKACRRLNWDYNPPITFLVVQKRHHTRLFAQFDADKLGRNNGNVPPGTLVDTDIVHPTEHDFYLVSHYGIQGTSRPTHYHVLWDDSEFSSDELQTLTYYLCYMFSRCTRSVSYPAPCYYSHLVAYRGRQYYDALTKQSKAAIPFDKVKERINSSRKMEHMFFV